MIPDCDPALAYLLALLGWSGSPILFGGCCLEVADYLAE